MLTPINKKKRLEREQAGGNGRVWRTERKWGWHNCIITSKYKDVINITKNVFISPLLLLAINKVC